MERVYRVVSLQRSGGKQYWEPVACSFLREKFPTNEYSTYSDALSEYRNAISSVADDYTFSVSLEERTKTGSQYWEPTLGLFTYKEIPTNRYYNYPEAHREYRRAVEVADTDDIASVSLLEYRKKDDTWYTLTWLELEREYDSPTEQVMIDIDTVRVDVRDTSCKLREIAEIPKLSRETREEIERISNKLYSLSRLTWNLQDKVLKEIENDIQDTED